MLDWHAVAVISAMLFLEGVIEPTNNINQLSLRLSLMPREMRGRLTSVVRFLIRGAYPLGALVGGASASGSGSACDLADGARRTDRHGCLHRHLDPPLSSVAGV